MPKITFDDLEKIRERSRGDNILRDGGPYRARVTVHMGTCGIAAGARGIMDAFMQEIEKEKIKDVLITNSGCAGLCSHEPMATVEIAEHSPVKYIDLTPEKVHEIFINHVINGKTVNQYALALGSERVL